MSLEQALKENTEAVLKLAALMEGAKSVGGASAATDTSAAETTTTTRRGRGRPSKAESEAETKTTSKYTAEQVKAAAVKVKDALGSEAAKKLIADHGAPKLDQLKPEDYEAFINAAEKLINGGDDDGDDGDDDL